VTLIDINSVVNIETQSQLGVFDWQVDGVDHLQKQWFWYRVGATGPEKSIDTLVQTGIAVTDTNPFTDPGFDTLSVLYSDPGGAFDINVKLTLTGGAVGSKTSDLGEQITITNKVGGTLDFHFFQYADFDLNLTAGDDTAQQINANTVRQSDPLGILSETVGTPAPSHVEIALFPTTLTKLNDTDPTQLSDASGPVTGNATWAWQWDFALTGLNSNLLISKDKQIKPSVPQPMSLLILGLGLVAIAVWSRGRGGLPRLA
jgi:hypothetical protein